MIRSVPSKARLSLSAINKNTKHETKKAAIPFIVSSETSGKVLAAQDLGITLLGTEMEVKNHSIKYCGRLNQICCGFFSSTDVYMSGIDICETPSSLEIPEQILDLFEFATFLHLHSVSRLQC